VLLLFSNNTLEEGDSMNRYRFVLLFLMLAALNLFAGQVNYTVAGTFSSDVPYTALTAPNQSFNLTFSIATPVVPNFVDSQGFEVDSVMSYSSGSVSMTLPMYPGFYYQWQAGMFDLLFYPGPDSYDFALFGTQLFSGPAGAPVLLLGTFPIEGSILYYNNSYVYGGITGTVNATSVPEPSSLLLIGSALIGLAGKFLRAK
jgi:hypothetical protein